MKVIDRVRETAKVLKTLSRKPKRQPPKRLQARVRATTAASADEYEDEEPQTKLTSAFVVVLILHIVAVGGIYAFNEIKASRKTVDAVPSPEAKSTPAVSAMNSNSGETGVGNQRSSVLPSATSPAPAPLAASMLKPRSYTVKSGDTLHGIAKTYGMSVSDLKSANGLAGDGIREGQSLNITAVKPTIATSSDVSSQRPEAAEAKLSFRNYTVKSGDRLVFIAKRFSVSQEDLIAANKIKDPSKLQIGQTLKIPSKK